ncbi:MAG: hypothetical protein VX936_09755, partial [Planctomycetota bacterium]|nr:hypothetical protein [Planctomycetota bacterium]
LVKVIVQLGNCFRVHRFYPVKKMAVIESQPCSHVRLLSTGTHFVFKEVRNDDLTQSRYQASRNP